jgi:hypothetical protein
VEMNDWILCFGQVDCILQADNSECVVAWTRMGSVGWRMFIVFL